MNCARALTLLLALCCALPAFARPRVQMTVIDRDTGQPLTEHRHRGDRWIVGVPGHDYAVQLRNNTGQRVLVVLSIDGVNAVTGETADPLQSGYVLGPWQSVRIDGWRKSLRQVARFVFTDLGDSYAARTGRPDNVGVIGVAVFEAARPIHYRRHAESRADAARERAAPAAPAASMSKSLAGASADRVVAEQALGTGHGSREWSPVSHTDFQRASQTPAQVSSLRYDARANLVARGVLPDHRHWHGVDEPRAFPVGFVPDPPQ